MDATIAQILIGVVSNALFALVAAPFNQPASRRNAVLAAVQRSLDGLVEVPQIDEQIGGERLRALLESAEVASLVRQIFAAEALDQADKITTSRRLFGRLYEAYVGSGADLRVADRLFDVMVSGASAALVEATGQGMWAAHDALESLRHNLVMDAIAGVDRMLELLLGDAPPPDLERIATFAGAYRTQAASRLGSITPPSFDAVRRVPIDSLYVSPTIIAARIPGRDQPDTWELSDLVKRLHRLVVLGSPGGGKSTLARKLCHDVALDRLQGELIPRGTVPVLVVLRDYGTAKLEHAASIRDFVEARAHADYQLDVPVGAVEYLLQSGRVLVVFDGLDELLDTSYRADVSADIESFAALYPLTPMLVTSRRVGYAEAPLTQARFDTALLGDFGEAQVAEYARKWFSIVPSDSQRELDSEVSDFISDSEQVTDLRSNALMLALMCNLYRGAGYIPRKRPELYEKCAVMLFERWDRGRRILTPLDFERHLRPALQYLAHWMYSTPGMQSGVSERTLVRQAAAFLQRKRFPDEDDARAEAAKFVSFCRGRAWVFTDTGTTPTGELLYEFTHRTFLEFFTAEHLVRTCRSPEGLATELLPHIRRAEWDVVAQLAFQLQDDNLDGAADELLAAVLTGASEPDGDGRYRLLEFAARSLSFLVPEPQTLGTLTETIVRETLEQYGSADQGPPSQDAFRALARVDWENRETVSDAVRAAVVRAAEARGVSIAALLEVGLHMDLAVPSEDRSAARAFWQQAGFVTGMKLEEVIRRAALVDSNAAADAMTLGILSPGEVSPHHSVEVFFRSRGFRLYPSRARRSMADTLLHAASGAQAASTAWLPLVPGTLGRYLSELGQALRRTDPPWFREDTLYIGVSYVLQGDGMDPLGPITGDAAFGLIGALGVVMEDAEDADEVDESLEVLTSSAIKWQRMLAPLVRRRYKGGKADVVRRVARLELHEGAAEMTRQWATRKADFTTRSDRE
jgi:hypothetical protein